MRGLRPNLEPAVAPLLPPRASARLARLWASAAGLCSLLLQLQTNTGADASPGPAGPTPFFNLRQSTLNYHGPSADFTNLTELRIGWFGPTNLNDPLHGDLWWAANRAVDEANAALPISELRSQISNPPHLPFRLVPRWSVDPWGTGIPQLTRMVYDEQPLAVLGSVDSASTHLAEQIVAKANLPLVSPVATDPSVTLAGVPWMFACAPSDVAVARVLANEILEFDVRGGSPSPRAPFRLVLLTATDHESRMTSREVLQEFSRRQRLPDFRLELSTRAGALDHLLTTLAEIEPQVMLIVSGAEDAARLVRAIRDDTRSGNSALWSAAIFGSQAMGRTRFLELAGDAAEGVRFPLLAVPAPDDAGAVEFIEAFTAARGHAPDYAAILTCDATRLLLAAIREAGPNRDRVRSALTGLSPWTGMGGTIRFDGTGQNTRDQLALATIRRGCLEWTTNGPNSRTSQPWRDELRESALEEGMKRRPRGNSALQQAHSAR
jgi:branched-chain amino acid transport system substrate-binding protein